MAKITRVEQAVPTIKTKKKVAAYARISMESERMNRSLSAQISYYSSLIQKNPDCSTQACSRTMESVAPG